jgi:hypothetical protein
MYGVSQIMTIVALSSTYTIRDTTVSFFHTILFRLRFSGLLPYMAIILYNIYFIVRIRTIYKNGTVFFSTPV